MVRLLICGSRVWNNWAMIYEKIVAKSGEEGLFIIDGHASGADHIAHRLRDGFEWQGLCFPANWSKFGKAAGPIRNQQMIDEGKPDVIWAFHNDIEHSKGTKDMQTKAKKYKIPFIIFSEKTV